MVDELQQAHDALIRSLRRFVGAAARDDAALARELGLHSTDLATLDLVFSSAAPVTPQKISEHLGISSGATTGAIDRIEKVGYVRRVPNPKDRRGAYIEPMPGRAEDVLVIYRAFIERYADVLSMFSEAELLTAARLLQVFCDRSDNPDAPLPLSVGRPR